MNLNENSLKVLEKRYLAKDINGNLIEKPVDLFKRVAKVVASADVEYVDSKELNRIEETFFDLMTKFEFLPNSPTLMNAGRPLGQLSACFVLPIDDSMEDIFESIKNAALIHKSGGGTGFSFSRLRPKNSTVKTTGGVASGPISFMKVFNSATEAVKQGGTRRGANMGILRIDHPDIIEFIESKSNNAEITNFNISVGITEDFMKAVEKNTEYALVSPQTKEVVGKLNAKDIFDKLVSMAWKNGEPGIIFLDRMNEKNVTPLLGEIESTNPCGEQPLLPYEACNLGSINLSVMVKKEGNDLIFDYERLKRVIFESVHFLDNVIDVNKYPLPKIDEMTRGTRKIGLGVMGWADVLCKLNIPYDSQEALDMAESVMKFIQDQSRAASIKIAEKKGVFPLYESSIYKDMGIKVRNATTTTIAPTGTLSIIAGVSSGIEPLFALSYIRNVMGNHELLEVNPLFKQIAVIDGFYSDELMKKIAEKGSIKGISQVPEDIQNVFLTAHDITPESHVKMQAAFQKYTDNAVSKTVNLSHDASKEKVEEIFRLSYKLYCKGITIYRDGSRDMQVLNIGEVKGKEKDESVKVNTANEKVECKVVPRTRPEITTGFTEKVKIGCGNLYITVNYDDDGICEVFTNTGRAGGCPSQSEATSRLISIALRSGIAANSLVEQLKGIRCSSTIKQKDIKVLSCPDAIGRLIEKIANLKGQNVNSLDSNSLGINNLDMDNTINGDRDGKNIIYCPECGKKVEHEGGCFICRECGFSKCG